MARQSLSPLFRFRSAPLRPSPPHLHHHSIHPLTHNLSPSPRRHYSAPSPHQIPAAKQKYVPTSGTYPLGFLASGTHVGVKPSTPKSIPDLALITSTRPSSAAAVFTKNKFQAAPVTVSREVLRRRKGDGIRGIVVNSGCANAVTGRGGVEDAERMVGDVDRLLGKGDEAGAGQELARALVMSTGVIGQRLPISKILSALPTAHATLSSTHDSWLAAARAICTTDTFPKLLTTTFTLPSHPDTTYRLAGMTKGAGMIHPNMATLLGLLFTDCAVEAAALQPLLTHAVDRSFNCISVDGDTSTNDTVSLLANGCATPAGQPPISLPPSSSPSSQSEDYHSFSQHLTTFTQRLAQLIIRDGEGATKFVTVRVTRAASYAVAHRVAASIATSPLVKTALYGKDANWGRILCAIGYTPGLEEGDLVPGETSVSFVRRAGRGVGDSSLSRASSSSAGEKPGPITEELHLLVDGEPETVDEERAGRMLEDEDLEILVRLRKASSSSSSCSSANKRDQTEEDDDGTTAVYWTCDFSHEYVTINGDYRT